MAFTSAQLSGISKGGGISVGGGIRPAQSLSSTERSGFIDAERTLSKLNAKPVKGPATPWMGAGGDRIPKGKATY
jgi:hypothetical protein